MATFESLPPEILIHIHKLSHEGESPQEQQRARFAFGLVARAFFLATADATEFHVAGAKQAKAFTAKLERDAVCVVSEGSGDTPFIPRISNVRRLSLVLDDHKGCETFATLLRATPNLIALNLDAAGVTMSPETACAESLAEIQPALGGLALLRELKYRTYVLDKAMLMRILIPLKELRVLALESEGCFSLAGNPGEFFERVALPHLQTLRLERNTFNNALICALANLTAGIKVLACTNFNIRSVPFAPVELLVPIVASLVDFTWTPGRGFIVGSNLSKGARDEILALLGAMKSLKSIHIALWIYVQQPILHLIDDYQPTDPGLFDTLATLPSLSTVKLLVNSGKLGEEHVISYLKSHDALRFLSTRFETDGRWTLSWTPEQRRRVEDASEGAGINFTYSEIHA